MMLKRGNILFHASGIEHLGSGMAIAGFSGAGKSTMALHMMRRGLKFVSNDRIMAGEIGRGVVMHGVPKLPRVNPGTVLTNPKLISVIPEEEREEFLKLPADELWDLEHKYDVHIDEIFGPEKVVLNAPMRSLIILNWKRDVEAKVKSEKVDLYRRRDLLKAFMKDTGLFFLEGRHETKYNGTEEAYLKLLENVQVYELSGGVDFEDATEILMDILDGQIKK
jgi:HprK-related kinase B